MTETGEKREEIIIVGGGLGGCLTALMLAKNPQYHVTLIEAQDTLLNGASTIAARLHLGGEYPLHPKTSRDCLNGASIWKMLMPDSIYTPVPPMKFLVADNTERSRKLTVSGYLDAYENIRGQYKKICTKVQKAVGAGMDTVHDMLFGSPDKGKFFRQLRPEEYADYHQGATKIAGGFQSPELGLNIPKYLSMIQGEIDKQVEAGNITVKTGHKVKPQGIRGEIGQFSVECLNGELIHGSQVVQAAWQGGPEIMPLPKNKRKSSNIYAFKRAMLLVELPEGFKTPPAFIMLGEDGGMMAPFNDKMALCYIPTEAAAYYKDEVLTVDKPSLPASWNDLSDEQYRLKCYLEAAKQRFPVLKDVDLSKARLVIRDTLSFDDKLSARTNQFVEEAIANSSGAFGGMGMVPVQRLEIMQQLVTKMNMFRSTNEVQRGLFTLYPTKATYSLQGALQAEYMVRQRSAKMDVNESIRLPKDMLDYVLSEENLEKYSLKHMAEPTRENYDQFFRQHPDFADPEQKMLATSWQDGWVSKTSAAKRTSWGMGNSVS